MKLFYGRPLCFGCAGAVCAAFFCAFAGCTASFIAAGAALVFALLSLLFLKPRGGIDRRLYAVLLFSLICAVCLSSGLYYSDKERYVTEDQVFIVGYVDPSYVSDSRYKIKVTNLDGRPVNIDMCADLGYYTPYGYAKFSAYGKVSKIEGEDAQYLKGKGVFYETELTRLSFNGTQRGFLCQINNLRRYIASRFYSVSDGADLYCCLFLGQRHLAPASFASDLRSLGVTHLLAVSGLHVVALLAGAEFAMTRIFGRRRFIFALLAPAALFYMALAGFSGSVMRAAIMYFIMRAGKAFDLKTDAPTSLFLAVFLMLFACPYAVYDTGFLLSASAAAGIILVGSPAARALDKKAENKNGFVKWASSVAGSFAVTLSALVFTMPAAAFGYGKVVFISLIANLVIGPFIMALLYACPYLILFSFVPYAGGFAGAFCDGVFEVAEKAAHALTCLPPLSVSVKYDFMKYLIALFALAALALIFSGVKKRAVYTALCAAFAVTFVCSALIYNAAFAKKDVLIVQSSGKGELVALCSGGSCTVYDFSEGAPAYALAEELLRHGVTKADYVCAAEFSSYHIQSVPVICRTLNVGSLTLPYSVGAPLCAELCGKTAEYFNGGGSAEFVCGKITVKISREVLQKKTYTAADFGAAAYSDGLPVYGKQTVIYGDDVIDPAVASFSAESVYLPEKYSTNEDLNENTEFYGEVAVMELK